MLGAIATERFWRGEGVVVQIYYQNRNGVFEDVKPQFLGLQQDIQISYVWIPWHFVGYA